MTAPTTDPQAPQVATPAQAKARRKIRKPRNMWLLVILLGPALFFLLAFVIYPIGYSIVRSMFNRAGDEFIGLGNYTAIFTDPQTFHALKNNLIWVLVAPAVCTLLGLVFAVLLEKIRWATAFKLIIFMPMAISMLAAGVIFRTVFQQNPDIGLANAMVVTAKDLFTDSANYPNARVRPDLGFDQAEDRTITSTATHSNGDVVGIPLIGINQDDVPAEPTPAVPSDVRDDAITGTVWLDFVPGGGGEQGEIDADKPGLGGITVQAVDDSGEVVADAVTDDDGRFTIEGVDGPVTIQVDGLTFAQGPSGIDWLGPSLITPVIILSYVWIWAGFAMVMIASGLSAIDRSLLEAARTDGANEWQVFRHITVPQLMPVITVVLVTLMINVLKIFDLVYVIPPGNSKPAADVIATRMWQVSYGGGNDQGLGSALAIVLLIMVLPFMILNIRNFRKGGQQ